MKRFEAWYSRSKKMEKEGVVSFFEGKSVNIRTVIMVEQKDKLWKKIDKLKEDNLIGESSTSAQHCTSQNINPSKFTYEDSFFIVEEITGDIMERGEDCKMHVKHTSKTFYYVEESIEQQIFDLRGKLQSKKFNF